MIDKLADRSILRYVPVLGIGLFLLLFLSASAMYPGGSQADPKSEGYDWFNNYWCDLLNPEGQNGLANPARPIAIIAMFILCTALGVFSLQFARMVRSALWRKLISVCGVMSMFFALLMFTDLHNMMIIVSSVFGAVAMLGIIKAVYQSEWKLYRVGGVVCLILLALSNIIYYSSAMIQWLPLIQKLTLLAVLWWVAGLSIRMTNSELSSV